jgi:hypothetical protein
LNCAYNKLTELKASNNPELVFVECWGNNLSELDFSSCNKLVNLLCDDGVTVTGYNPDSE